jgi:hypothetical protein
MSASWFILTTSYFPEIPNKGDLIIQQICKMVMKACACANIPISRRRKNQLTAGPFSNF